MLERILVARPGEVQKPWRVRHVGGGCEGALSSGYGIVPQALPPGITTPMQSLAVGIDLSGVFLHCPLLGVRSGVWRGVYEAD